MGKLLHTDPEFSPLQHRFSPFADENADHATAAPTGRAYHSKLTRIKAQFFALNTAAVRGTSDEMEATRHRAHYQWSLEVRS